MWALVQSGSRTAVGQTRAEHVLDGRHRQEVIDAEQVALVEPLGEQVIQLSRTVEVLSERLLEHHLALGGKPRPVQRRDRDREDGGRQSEVDGDGAFAGEARRHAVRIGEVDPSIARCLHDRRRRRMIDAGPFALEPPGGPASEPVVVPVVASRADELESRRKVAPGVQRGEAGKQVRPIRSPLPPKTTSRSIT
jgi:hypothetical protein